VLWLQVTGTFFALIALVMGGGAWRLREIMRKGAGGSHELMKLYLCVAIAAVFAYFAVSSFVRAERR
jgi:undecaprenyl pyrophosphate phosphatase UppP